MVGRAFLVAGDEEGDGTLVLRVVGDEALDGDDHRRQAAFHVRRAAPAEHALVVDQGVEGLVLPGLQRAGGDHVGVPGEAQHRAVAAAPCPEVVHLLDAHRLQGEAGGFQAAHHQGLAVGVERRDGGAADQLAGEFEGRRETRRRGGHGEGILSGSSGKGES